jgi:hypothetical protein
MNAVLRDLLREGRFTPVASYQRLGYAAGALLLLSAALHVAVFLIDGGPWDGPLSWRKPILFGFSFGITLVTLTWFTTFMRMRPTTGWIVVGALAIPSLGEVALISMQTWRGVASHFNETTAFDELVFSIMGMLVTVIALATIFLAIRAFIGLDASPSLALAIRCGLLLLLVSQAVGVSMIIEGGNTFGAAGPMKVPHAVTLHAAQVLPALALVLRVSGSTEERRSRIVLIASLGYASLIAATMLQTYAGRGTLDVTVGSTAVALLGLVLLGGSGFVALRDLWSRILSADQPAPTPG